MQRHLLHGLAVALVHRQEKEGQHDQHHEQGGGAGAQPVPAQKEQRYADERAADEADKLPLGQIESDLGFDFRQVLGDRNIGHLQHILLKI